MDIAQKVIKFYTLTCLEGVCFDTKQEALEAWAGLGKPWNAGLVLHETRETLRTYQLDRLETV
jgi:hypothetical protein